MSVGIFFGAKRSASLIRGEKSGDKKSARKTNGTSNVKMDISMFSGDSFSNKSRNKTDSKSNK
jgi:hypothetical protein